jgi:hypothetical protein
MRGSGKTHLTLEYPLSESDDDESKDKISTGDVEKQTVQQMTHGRSDMVRKNQ